MKIDLDRDLVVCMLDVIQGWATHRFKTTGEATVADHLVANLLTAAVTMANEFDIDAKDFFHMITGIARTVDEDWLKAGFINNEEDPS